MKNLKSIFVVQSGSAGEQEESNADKAAPKEEVTTPKVSIEPIDPSTLAEGKVNSKFMEILLKAIEANNQSGFDYLEYKRALQNLGKMSMDEATRYKSAFAAAQTMGVTPSALLESAKHYLGVLDQEQSKFGNALTNQRAQQIDGGQQKMVDLEKAIAAKEDQIAVLQKEITQARAEYDQMHQEVQNASIKVEQTRINFETTFASLTDQIKQDVANIKQYLTSSS
ncbi:MAG: hypothetical protein KTR24_15705 [Saprospiraceae bacterium]|nr:hypothetical protein [Saprospiraceae bacterium]